MKGFGEQSPFVMNIALDKAHLTDWSTKSFSMVPNFNPASIQSIDCSTHTFKLILKETEKFNGFWAVEPSRSIPKFVEYHTDYI